MSPWTSRAGSERRAAAAACGFTLVELLVAITLLVLVAGAVAGLSLEALRGAELKAGVRELAAALRAARNEAVREQRETTVRVDVEARTYSFGARTARLPAQADVRLLTTSADIADARRGALRFFPDGSSGGGGITLVSGDVSYRVDVNWVTGGVSVRE